MDLSSQASWKSWFVPGGVLVLLAASLLQGGFLAISGSAVDFFYYAVFAGALLLAWRFHSSRVMFALITLLLAHRALEFFAAGRVAIGPGRIAFEAIAFLLPANFILLSFVRERGLSVPAIAPRLGLLFLESVFVAVVCRPGAVTGPWFIHGALLKPSALHWTRLPQPALLMFALAFAVMFVRFRLYRKPLESGLLWSLAAAFLGLQTMAMATLGSGYFATAALVLAASMVENSYLLAYHDELTTLSSRRAFNEALLRIEDPYSIAVVDIDHFKNFNDTYGHDSGDQALRLVAAQLARVTGGGQAYRVGGEEFSILFSGKSVTEVMPHLESLRAAIAESSFQVRAVAERRGASRGPDRRDTKNSRTMQRRKRNPHAIDSSGRVSLTVSIGVAGSQRALEAEQVVQAADEALYGAKSGGRNRVEMAGAPRTRSSRAKRSIA